MIISLLFHGPVLQCFLNLFYLSNSPIKVDGQFLTCHWLPCTSTQGKLIPDNGLMQSNKTLLATAVEGSVPC